MRRLAIIGDVHGEAQQLHVVLRQALTLGRRVILVGDYVNRGLQSARVLDLLCDALESVPKRLVLLRGNHDEAFVKALESNDLVSFLAMGGARTIRSYLSE